MEGRREPAGAGPGRGGRGGAESRGVPRDSAPSAQAQPGGRRAVIPSRAPPLQAPQPAPSVVLTPTCLGNGTSRRLQTDAEAESAAGWIGVCGVRDPSGAAGSGNQGSGRKMSRPGRAAEQRRRTATTRERQAETSSSVPREERREPVDGGKEDFPERAQNPASRRPNQQRLHPDDPRTRRARGFGCSARLRRLSPGLPSGQNAVLFHSPTLLMSPAGA